MQLEALVIFCSNMPLSAVFGASSKVVSALGRPVYVVFISVRSVED